MGPLGERFVLDGSGSKSVKGGIYREGGGGVEV